jgi:hypothetical protein
MADDPLVAKLAKSVIHMHERHADALPFVQEDQADNVQECVALEGLG